jgi:hypothetical protein
VIVNVRTVRVVVASMRAVVVVTRTVIGIGVRRV